MRNRGRQRATCSTPVLGAMRALNRLDGAIESLRSAMGAPAVAAPDWLRARADPVRTGRHAEAAQATSPRRGGRPRAGPSPKGSGVMGMRISPRSWPLTSPPGCARCRPSSCCGGSGFRPSSSTTAMGKGGAPSAPWRAGGPGPRASHPRVSWWHPRTTPSSTTAREALDETVDRHQGPPDGDLRRWAAASRHPCRDHARARHGPRRARLRARGAGGEGFPARPPPRPRRPPRRPVSS